MVAAIIVLKVLMKAARQQGFVEMNGEVLSENYKMLQLVNDLGFTSIQSKDASNIRLISKIL